jgi:RNA polymerase sigma-70 factor (ECF subfamily)
MLLFLTFASDSDKDKFEYLYHKYKRLLLYKANQILNDYTLAEDAVSEAYIRIYKNLHKIENTDSGQTIAFLMLIVKNTSLTILDKEKRKQTTQEPDEDLAGDYNLEEDVISRLSTERIYELIEQLGEELKSIFLLRYAQDLSHKEIGKLLNITESNVGVKIHRAKKKLKEMIEKEGM